MVWYDFVIQVIKDKVELENIKPDTIEKIQSILDGYGLTHADKDLLIRDILKNLDIEYVKGYCDKMERDYKDL